MAHPVEVNSENFQQEVLDSSIPVLVDFWAEWCAPCHMVAPAVEKVGADFEGKLKVCKLNVDDSRDIAERYGIRGIPSLFFFKSGEVVLQHIGVTSADDLAQKAESVISSS